MATPQPWKRLAESPDDNSRNITGAMTMVAARLASINKEIAMGNLYPLNITDEIAQAADIMQSLRDMGQSVDSFLAQQKLFTDVDPMVAERLQVFSRFARSRVKLTAIFNAYADALEDVGNPRQMELLGQDGCNQTRAHTSRFGDDGEDPWKRNRTHTD